MLNMKYKNTKLIVLVALTIFLTYGLILLYMSFGFSSFDNLDFSGGTGNLFLDGFGLFIIEFIVMWWLILNKSKKYLFKYGETPWMIPSIIVSTSLVILFVFMVNVSKNYSYYMDIETPFGYDMYSLIHILNYPLYFVLSIFLMVSTSIFQYKHFFKPKKIGKLEGVVLLLKFYGYIFIILIPIFYGSFIFVIVNLFILRPPMIWG